MHLAALTAGVGADPQRVSGEVHSIFARAINLALRSGGLVGLVVREVGAVPCGFQLATPPRFSFADCVRAGERAVCRGGILRIAGSPLRIDLRFARTWHSALADHPIDCARSATAICWRAAWEALAEQGGAAPLARQAGGAVAGLFAAAQRLHPGAARGAVSQLIGLGDGLTPAGDDFLVGFLAGLRALPQAGETRRAFRAGFAADVAGQAHRTGAISRLYLDAAAAGEVSERLAALSAAIGRGDRAETLGRAAALEVGASSGAAAVYGLLLAVRTAADPVSPMPALPLPAR